MYGVTWRKRSCNLSLSGLQVVSIYTLLFEHDRTISLECNAYVRNKRRYEDMSTYYPWSLFDAGIWVVTEKKTRCLSLIQGIIIVSR